jgi:hypothetical protein
VTALLSEEHGYASYAELLEDYHKRGWTDGLPVVAPEPELVLSFLAAGGLDSTDVLGEVPSREIVVTAEDAAINAVMAGACPEYMPVVAAAVRALLHEEQVAHSTTATLMGAMQVVIVNGPVRGELGINCGQGCFGPGFRANATIGRALRLLARNVIRSIPGQLDRAVFSTPGRYSFCFGEDEEHVPWAPLHVERGYPSDVSTVTVHSTSSTILVIPPSTAPEPTLAKVVDLAVADTSLYEPQMGNPADVVLVLGFEHARIFDSAGWDKARIRGYLYDALSAVDHPTGPLRLGRPDGLLLVTAGGPGWDASVLMPPHVGRAVTEPVL